MRICIESYCLTTKGKFLFMWYNESVILRDVTDSQKLDTLRKLPGGCSVVADNGTQEEDLCIGEEGVWFDKTNKQTNKQTPENEHLFVHNSSGAL